MRLPMCVERVDDPVAQTVLNLREAVRAVVGVVSASSRPGSVTCVSWPTPS
mgnify:CR=1 FL=1